MKTYTVRFKSNGRWTRHTAKGSEQYDAKNPCTNATLQEVEALRRGPRAKAEIAEIVENKSTSPASSSPASSSSSSNSSSSASASHASAGGK